MANIWKKITKKIDGVPMDSPFAGDWEAMNSKIEAHPSLNSSKRKGAFWFRTIAGILVVLLMGLGVVALWPNEELVLPVENPNNTSLKNENKKPLNSESTTTENNLTEEVVKSVREIPIVSDIDQNREQAPDRINKTEIQTGGAAAPSKLTVEDDNSTNEGKPYKSVNRSNVDIVGALPIATPENINGNDGLAGVHQASDKPIEEETQLDEQTLAFSSIVEEDWMDREADEELGVEVNRADSENLNTKKNDNAPVALRINDEMDGDTTAVSLNPPVTEELKASADKEEDTSETSSLNKSSEAESPDLAKSGFKITTISTGGLFLTDYSKNFIGYGGGVDVDWQRNGWLLNTGLFYNQMNFEKEKATFTDYVSYDTSIVEVTTIRGAKWVRALWVILGEGKGEYKYDTIITPVTDTTYESRIDTSTITTKSIERAVVRMSYLEMPLLLGHRFRFNQFGVDIYGGAVLNQTISITQGESEQRKSFGMDILFQPSIRYYVRPELSVYTRAALRYGVMGDDLRTQKLYSSFQIGLSYHW